MIEEIIAIICLITFLFTKDIEILKTCGIFSIASYLGHICHKMDGRDD